MVTSQQQPILLVSLTARMLAELAVRAGYDVLALDYFGDADLQALCPSRSLRYDYGQAYSPAALVQAARDWAAPAVVYGASFENQPAQVTRLAQGRQLLGNPPETLRQIRRPDRLAAALQAGGFVFPETFTALANRTRDPARRWLWKPLHSGGGHSIRFWGNGRQPAGGILQEYLTGLVGSISFVADGRQAVVLGLTEQLAGSRFFGATGFRYAGNLIPPRLPADELTALLAEAQALANYLTQTFRLRGLNGLDFIWHQGRVWTLEVNPRPSASLELIDTAYQLRVFDVHVRSFTGQLPHFNLAQAMRHGPAAGKAILYAVQNVNVGDTGRWFAQGIRDVPRPVECIEPGHPICTLLATGTTATACLQDLQAQAGQVRSWLQEDY